MQYGKKPFKIIKIKEQTHKTADTMKNGINFLNTNLIGIFKNKTRENNIHNM